MHPVQTIFLVFIGVCILGVFAIIAKIFLVKEKGDFLYLIIAIIAFVIFINGDNIRNNVVQKISNLKYKIKPYLANTKKKEIKKLEKNENQTGKTKKSKEEKQLASRLNEIAQLHQNLINRKMKISTSILAFKKDSVVLKKNILRLKKEKKINTFSQAKNDSEIKYELELLRQKNAYINELVTISKQITLGKTELIFLKNKIEMDLKMVAVLKIEDNKQLSEKINKVIKSYMPYSKEPVLRDLIMPELKEIWKKL